MTSENESPRYVISIAAKMLGVQSHTLRYYEKIGIIEPLRSGGKTRLYSERDIAYLKRVKTLVDELGVNLAGVEVILRMAQRVAELQERVEQLEAELKRSKRRKL
ncbi:MAG: MerR family transcriptional regulator [Chloroflexi bacterium]|nr:MerR family transcriptional regulator [Chloroflexota bacterium]